MTEKEDNHIKISDVKKDKRELSKEVVIENERFLNFLNDEKEKAQELVVTDKRDRFKEAVREEVFEEVVESKPTKPTTPPAQKKEKESMSSSTVKKYVSLKLGVIGSGQAGGRIAEVFYKHGYDALAINTASQDLEYLDLPDANKMLIEGTLGGTGKDTDISLQCFEDKEEEIRGFLEDKLEDCEAYVLTLSGAGGTGSGSAEILANWLYEMGRPLIVIYVLPGQFDDSQGKFNALNTLASLSELASEEVISSLVLVDNAAIEAAYPNLSPSKFWNMANSAVVAPLHAFNSLSETPTEYDALDSMDFAKALIEAPGCSTFGTTKIEREWWEEDETALMEAVVTGLEDNLLAGGFDLKQAQSVGIAITARKDVLESIQYTSISYMLKYISDEFDSAKVFKGIYAVPAKDDDITIHFLFSGMSLPKDRVDLLKTESDKHQKQIQSKRSNLNMKVGIEKDRATSSVEKNLAKIKRKKSSVSKLMGKSPKKRPRRR